MEFDASGKYDGRMLEVPVPRLLPSQITVVSAETMRIASQRHRNALEVIIDNFGKRSAVAQGLGAVITTMQKLMCTDHKLYIHRSDRAVNGILKVGRKHLFIRDVAADKMHEIEPLCVLDFYVHESLQKRGIGRQLFDEMLAREKVEPHMLGYDRPSPKLLSFLRKHFSLMDYEPQANNFVVFRSYFRSGSSNSKENLHVANGRSQQSRQRSDSNFVASNSFFLGGKGASHGQQPSMARSRHPGLPPPSAPAVMGKQGLREGDLMDVGERKFDELDSLTQFAKRNHLHADMMQRRREDGGSSLASMGAVRPDDVGLQEKASNHFMSLQAYRRPGSGRSACLDMHMLQDHALENKMLLSMSHGSQGRDGMKEDRWRTANSEIGSHLKFSQAHSNRQDEFGGMLGRTQVDSDPPLPTAARFDRRIGNRLW